HCAVDDRIVRTYLAREPLKQPAGQDLSGADFVNERMIGEVKKRGGLICLHFYQGYIHPNHGPESTVEDLVDQISCIRKLAGIDSVALGVDFFPESGVKWIKEGTGLSGIENVERELIRRGFTDDEITKILGGNLLRVYGQIWK